MKSRSTIFSTVYLVFLLIIANQILLEGSSCSLPLTHTINPSYRQPIISDDLDFEDCTPFIHCNDQMNCSDVPLMILNKVIGHDNSSLQLTYTWMTDLYSNGTIDQTGNTEIVIGNFPLGKHKLIIHVTDQNGNANQCTRTIEVKDCSPPKASCISNFEVTVSPSTGLAAVWAQAIESGLSEDNCTSYGDLQFVLERRKNIKPGQTTPHPDATYELIVDCCDIPSFNADIYVEVVLWVGDQAGLWDTCNTKILVSDGGISCDCWPTFLSVYTRTLDAIPFTKTNVILNGNWQANDPVDNFGSATYKDLPLMDTLIVTTSGNNELPLENVDAYDLYLIQQHLFGNKPFSNAYQYIAADINNNCQITLSDLYELQKILLQQSGFFKKNKSWRIVVTDSTDNYTYFPCRQVEKIQFTPYIPYDKHLQFTAVKIGDLSTASKLSSNDIAQTRYSHLPLDLLSSDQYLEKGKRYTIPMYIRDGGRINGFQFSLEFSKDKIDLLQVRPAENLLRIENIDVHQNESENINVIWVDTECHFFESGSPLLHIEVIAKEDGMTRDLFRLSNHTLMPFAFSEEGIFYPIALQFNNPTKYASIEIHQNFPNPFFEETWISFTVVEDGDVCLSIHNPTGREVFHVKKFYTTGTHQISITENDLPSPGVWYYTLRQGTQSTTQQLLLMD